MKESFISLLVIAFLLSGCAKDKDSKNNTNGEEPARKQNQEPQAVDLAGKPLKEVLVLKYNKAEFSCSLWVQRNQKLNLLATPNDSITLDLKANSDVPQTFKLSGQIQNHRFEAQVEVTALSILGSFRSTDADGNQYKAEHSPYAEYNLTYTSATNYENGITSQNKSILKRQANEKIVDVAVNESHDSQPANQNNVFVNYGPYRNYVHCVITTEIKPEYQDQFEFRPRNP